MGGSVSIDRGGYAQNMQFEPGHGPTGRDDDLKRREEIERYRSPHVSDDEREKAAEKLKERIRREMEAENRPRQDFDGLAGAAVSTGRQVSRAEALKLRYPAELVDDAAAGR